MSQKIPCIFDATTLIGKRTADTRGSFDGEILREIDITRCGFFVESPSRYRLDGIDVTERPEWSLEQAEIEAAAAKISQISFIASQRYAIENEGVMFGEYQILTDRESQQILDSAIEKIRRGLVPSISWKCGNGKWLTLDADNISAVEVAVLSHVQGAFAWEKAELERLGLLEE